MENATLSFEQILNATVRMVRTTWKVTLCFFMQLDDQGNLSIRAADGTLEPGWDKMVFKMSEGLVGQCVRENAIVEAAQLSPTDALFPLLHAALAGTKKKYILVPVTGQSRVLGLLILGPMAKDLDTRSRETELRSAGALCAVLSAHWRLYEWMSHMLPQVNHELRTPLTAVQGSIGMVLGGMFGQVGSEVREMLEMAHKGCERTVRAIEGYLNNQEPPKDL